MIDAIGIAVLDHLPLGVDHVQASGRHCTFAGLARQGRAVWASGDDITCPLARFNLGLDAPDAETMARISAALVEWKAARDLDTAARLLSSFPRLPFGERVFVYAPLDAAPVYPDLVLRVVRPSDAVQWLRALGAATAERAEGRSGGVGALCGECTAFPLVTGRAAVSLGCPGCRREAFLAPDEILLALPYSLDRAANGS